MRLLGDWNWWAPGPLKRFADRLGFDHVEDEPDGSVTTDHRPGLRAPRDDGTGPAARRIGHGARGPGTSGEPPVLVGEVEEPGAGFGRGSFRMETRTWTWGDEDVRRGCPGSASSSSSSERSCSSGRPSPTPTSWARRSRPRSGVALLVSWATGAGLGRSTRGCSSPPTACPACSSTSASCPAGSGYGTFLFGLGLLGVAADALAGPPRRLGLAARRRRDPRASRAAGTWPAGSTRTCRRSGQLLGPLLLVVIGLAIAQPRRAGADRRRAPAHRRSGADGPRRGSSPGRRLDRRGQAVGDPHELARR